MFYCKLRAGKFRLEIFKLMLASYNFDMLVQSWQGVTYFPLDTGRRLGLDKTFRTPPGRLVSIFCAFNKRPMPNGFEVDESPKQLH